MAKILSGKEVASALNDKLKKRTETLKQSGIIPALAIIRVGEKPDDLAYEKGILKRAETVGLEVRKFVFAEDAGEEELLSAIEEINRDAALHGALIFKPLPRNISEDKIAETLTADKDVDGITGTSMAGVYSGKKAGMGFAPCTAEACMEILDYYGIDAEGKKAAVIGRSLVIGKPAAMMLIGRNATVTVCHTKTPDTAAVCREADIIIAAGGQAKSVGAAHLKKGQIIIDVGINVDDEGRLCGDLDFEEAEKTAAAITPVPGGVGTVTTSVLMKHVIEAAEQH